MSEKSRKVRELKAKIETSNLDSASIDLLSRIADELGTFQSSRPTVYYSLSGRLLVLNQQLATLQAIIQARTPFCSFLKKNKAIVTKGIEQIKLLLNQFELVIPIVMDCAIDQLKSDTDFTTMLEEYATDRGSNAMERLLGAFRESIEQMNTDKKYFLGKLKDLNEVAEGLGEFMQGLAGSVVDTEDQDKDDEVSNKASLGYVSIRLGKAAQALETASDIMAGEPAPSESAIIRETDDEEDEEEEEEDDDESASLEIGEEAMNGELQQTVMLMSNVMKILSDVKTAVVRSMA